MAINENIVIKLSADTSNYTAKMQAASRNAQELSKSLDQPRTAGERFEAGFTKVGMTIGAVSTAIGVAAVKAFADFDAAMSNVKANTGATGDELQSLRDAALKAGAATQYSAVESADAINELAKAGMSTKDILSGGLSGALNLAASDQIAVADAAELTATALNEFGLKGNQATHVADLLAAGAGTAQGGVADMGEALKKVGVNASQMGMSIEDTTGALTMLASKGIVGSDAGTQLRSALIGLTSASGPTQKAMDDLGISMYDGQGKFVGLANFAGQLKDKLGALTPEQRQAALGQLFSNAALTVGNTLYENGAEGVEKYTKQVDQQGFAQEQAAAKMDNLKGDIEQFGGAVETSMIQIGSGANGPLRSLVEGATDAITAFGELDPKIQQSVVVMGMAVGAAAGLHKMLGGLSESTSTFKNTIGLMFDPFERAKQGFSGLADAGRTLIGSFGSAEQQYQQFGTTVSKSEGMATAAKQGFGGIIDMLGGPWGIAMGAAAVAIGIFVQKQVDAKKRSDDFSDAINDGTSAVVKLQQNIASGDNIDWGWWQKGQTGADSFSEALDKAGISSKTFAKAVAGNKGALAEYNAKMKELELGTSSQVTLGQKITGVYNQEKKAMDQSKIAAKEKAEADAEATAEKNKNTYALAGNTDALNANGDAATEVASADDLLKDRTGGVTDAVTDTASAIKAVVDSLKDYYGFAESADKAEDSLAKSFDAATESINKNGNTANESKTALNNNSEAARANKDALYGIVDAAMDTASAYAAAGKSTGEIKDKTKDARDHFIDAAQQMGLSAEAANQLADSYGLIPDEVATQVLANTDPASAALTQIGVQVEHMPDGTVQISGDNKDAIDIIAATNGLTVDPKTGTVTMDKNQYDVALALANGATIDPKTGKLLGDNSDHWKKVAESNGWKINKKTGVISGNDGPFKATKADVDKTTIAGKTVKVGGDASGFWGTINGILSKTFSVNVKTKAGGATGGYFDGHMFNPGFASGGSVSGLLRGPGTGTSDSIHLSNANVANGEYVIRAAAVNQYGVPFLDAVNNQRYAAESVSKYMPANLTAYAQPSIIQTVTNDDVVAELQRFEGMIGPIISDYAPVMGERDFGRAVRKAVAS